MRKKTDDKYHALRQDIVDYVDYDESPYREDLSSVDVEYWIDELFYHFGGDTTMPYYGYTTSQISDDNVEIRITIHNQDKKEKYKVVLDEDCRLNFESTEDFADYMISILRKGEKVKNFLTKPDMSTDLGFIKI